MSIPGAPTITVLDPKELNIALELSYWLASTDSTTLDSQLQGILE